eukprot:4434998-Pleurochrysis_carterae.AAC.2
MHPLPYLRRCSGILEADLRELLLTSMMRPTLPSRPSRVVGVSYWAIPCVSAQKAYQVGKGPPVELHVRARFWPVKTSSAGYGRIRGGTSDDRQQNLQPPAGAWLHEPRLQMNCLYVALAMRRRNCKELLDEFRGNTGHVWGFDVFEFVAICHTALLQFSSPATLLTSFLLEQRKVFSVLRIDQACEKVLTFHGKRLDAIQVAFEKWASKVEAAYKAENPYVLCTCTPPANLLFLRWSDLGVRVCPLVCSM